MVSTKHCCWGECKTDSRYPDKWPKSLKEMEKSGKKVFIPFPKPSQGIEKCKRWIVSCSRQFFTEKSITRNTYICALHWPGEKGPTVEFPDMARISYQNSTFRSFYKFDIRLLNWTFVLFISTFVLFASAFVLLASAFVFQGEHSFYINNVRFSKWTFA